MATRTRVQRPVRPRRTESVEEPVPPAERDAEVEAAQADAESVLARIEALLGG